MSKNNFNFNNLLLFLIITNHIINSYYYSLPLQHDAAIHHYAIFNILNFRFNIDTAYSFIYYLFVSFFALITAPLYYFQLISDKEAFYLTIKISNLFLIIATFFLITLISKKQFKNNNFFFMIPALLIFSFAPINRTFLMARPENIMIPLSLIIFNYIIDYTNNTKINLKKKITYVISASIVCAQKITGIIFILSTLIYLFIFFSKKKNYYKIYLILFLLTAVLISLHYYLTGNTPLTRPYNLNSDLNKFLEIDLKKIFIFTNFSLIDAFNNPLRNAQKDSMINILFLDLFGDYWQYGIHNYKEINFYKECLIKSNQTSLFLSTYFFFLLICALIYFLKKKIFNKNKIIVQQIILVFSGFLILILGGFYEYIPEKGDIFKWEYINFFFIFSAFLVTKYLIITNKIKFNKILKITFFIFILTAYYQNSILNCHS